MAWRGVASEGVYSGGEREVIVIRPAVDYVGLAQRVVLGLMPCINLFSLGQILTNN